MSFKTHTEGGSWTGGGDEVPDCNLAEQNTITAAFNFLHTTSQPSVASFGGLDSLAMCLAGRTVQSVEIDCCGSGCGSSCTDNFGTSHIGGNSINLCNPALPPGGMQVDCDVTVFHELIHCCGGLEIDAWSMENHFYAGHGTITPGTSVVNGFLSETSDVGGGLRAATFVVWEHATGKVFVKISTGGSWDSSPTISRGALLLQNPAYVR